MNDNKNILINYFANLNAIKDKVQEAIQQNFPSLANFECHLYKRPDSEIQEIAWVEITTLTTEKLHRIHKVRATVYICLTQETIQTSGQVPIEGYEKIISASSYAQNAVLNQLQRNFTVGDTQFTEENNGLLMAMFSISED